jgi:hypothetical protein
MVHIVRREFEFFTVEAKKDTHHVDFTIYEGIGYLESFEEQVKLGIDPALGPGTTARLCRWTGSSHPARRVASVGRLKRT